MGLCFAGIGDGSQASIPRGPQPFQQKAREGHHLFGPSRFFGEFAPECRSFSHIQKRLEQTNDRRVLGKSPELL